MLTKAQNCAKRIQSTGIKVLLLVLAVSLVLCGIIGGTLAWLVDETESVTNTFTFGDINITLEETTGTEYKMMPGSTLDKDPTVTVLQSSEDCWLFVKIDESTDAPFGDFMTYEVADGWTKLEEATDTVYFRTVSAADVAESDVSFSVLKDNQVKVKEDVTKADFETLTQATYPTLTFTAYAVQLDDNVATAVDAWAKTSAGSNN